MTRYSTSLLYTAELLFDILFLIIVLAIYVKKIDKNSLWVYLLFGLFHSALELWAEGTGVRTIEDAEIFGLSLGYPFLPFILGYFEGGFICLGAYHFTRVIANKDKFSKKFSIILYALPFTMILIGAIMMKIQINESSPSITLTRRELFQPMSLILLIIFYSIALGYFLLNRKLSRKARLTLLYYFIGIILYTSVMNIPTHIAGIRYIEVDAEGGGYQYASLFEQFFVLYGLDLVLESGFYIQYYVIIYHFKIIQIDS